MTALLILNIMAIALAAAAWNSPALLDRLGTHAKARALALSKSRKLYHATFNAMTGRKPARQTHVFHACSAAEAERAVYGANVDSRRDATQPRPEGSGSRWARAMSLFSATFGVLLIVAAIAALVVMPQ